MGGASFNGSPQSIVSRELKLIQQQNDELRNSNRLKQIELQNGLSSLIQAASGQYNIASFNPLFQSTIAAPITINYTFLTYFYKTHGLVQTAINMPVLDALRGGVDLHGDDIDEDNVAELQEFLENEAILDMVGNAESWARLYGGGAIIVNDGGRFEEPLRDDMPIRHLQFYAAARWELGANHKLSSADEIVTNNSPWETGAAYNQEFYSYYGMRLHKSRVIALSGKEAPWMVRWQLQGWGMSEVERMVEDFNLYLRTRNVLYDLLNEAKVDVFMIDGMRDLLLSDEGEQKMLRRIQTVQQAKNLNNALLLDKEDVYEQKQLTFAGIAEVMKENKMGIASALRMPLSKLFGIAATGFNSGEDDIENYNAMVESEVRNHIRRPLRKVIDLAQRFLWGDVFKYQMKFKPLRVMSAKDEEDVRDKKFNRVVGLYDRGLMDSKEVGEVAQKDTLVSIDTKAAQGKLEEFPTGPAASAEDEGDTDNGRSKE